MNSLQRSDTQATRDGRALPDVLEFISPLESGLIFYFLPQTLDNLLPNFPLTARNIEQNPAQPTSELNLNEAE